MKQKEHARAERITNANEEKIGAGWKSQKTNATNQFLKIKKS